MHNHINTINNVYQSDKVNYETNLSDNKMHNLQFTFDQLFNESIFNDNMTELPSTILLNDNVTRTVSDNPEERDNYWALFAIILVIGTAAGNILVCLAIAWERRLQNVTNYFLMSLAITDLMVAILVMPLGTLVLIKGMFRLTYVGRIHFYFYIIFLSKHKKIN